MKVDRDSFLLGVLIALGEIYAAGEETTAEAILRALGPKDTNRMVLVAHREEDMSLPNLRATVRFLKATAR